jgi:hypothetical protein
MAENTFPENFPGKKQLEAAGVTPEQARAMSEEDLTQIDGIGPKTATDIRAQFDASEGQSPADGAATGNEQARAGAEPQASVETVPDKTGHTTIIR